MAIGSALAAGSALAGTGCGAFDRLDAPTQPGWCAGVVAGQAQGLRMPRTVLWMSGAKGPKQQLLVADMGSWEPARGRLVQLEVDTATGQVQATELLNRLDRPHGLRLGPDGRVYLAEATRILRFAWPPASGKLAAETVVDKLPAQGRHPLKEIAFAPDGSLYINVGAATDRCDKPVADGGAGRPQCPDAAAGVQPQAAVYRARFAWPQGKLESVQPFASGLRNSMALAVHASGTVWQAENNIDFDDVGFPAEEVNKLVEGGHYGWPGCVEGRKPLTGVPKAWCANTIAPELLMPAHAAPLHMEFSRVGAEPSSNRVGMLVSWHGYRAAGRRLVRYEMGADGTPKGKPTVLLGPWALDGKSAARPGAPVGWAEDPNGQLWIADDRNRMLIWLRRTEPVR